MRGQIRPNVRTTLLALTWGCSSAPNLRPVSVAGPDILVDAPGIDAQMDGSLSEDYDGAIVSFEWSMVSSPSNSQAQLESKDTPFPWLIPDVEGTYVVSLVVTDDQGMQSSPDILTVATPQYPLQTAPLADLIVTGDVGVGATLTLDGSGSTDPEGDPLSFEFTLQAAPQGSSAQIDHSTGPTALLTPDVAGTWILGLTVNDGTSQSARVDQSIRVDTELNQAPIAVCGNDQSVDIGQEVIVDGSQSFDPEGSPLVYEWALSSPDESAASLSDPTSVSPRFFVDVEGNYQARLRVNDGTTWSLQTCETRITVGDIIDNQPPVADAGDDQTTTTGDDVYLDGSASTDPDGDTLTFAWRLVDILPGSELELDSIVGADTPFPNLILDVAGIWQVELEVCDPSLACDADIVDLEVQESSTNSPPVADAGGDQLVELGDESQLDGSLSFDPDGDPLTYSWTFLEVAKKSSISDLDLIDATTASPSFTPDVLGDYELSLTVCDPSMSCSSDETAVTVNEIVNTPPTCDAGPDWSVATGDVVTLDATGSADADGDALTFYWTLSATPAGSAASIDDRSADITTFVPDLPGTYTVNLWASDSIDSCFDRVTVEAIGTNTPPNADAGIDQNASVGDSILLDGTGSSDPDGDALTYTWSWGSIPSDSTLTDADLVDSDTDTPSFTPDVAGTYEIALEVCDPAGACDTDSVTIDVTFVNTPPTCNAGADQSVDVGDSVTLDAASSSDADGDALTFYWALASAPSGSTTTIASPWDISTSFVPDLAGSYKINLWGNDGTDSCFDRVVIDAIGPNNPPVADAGDDQEVYLSDDVTLDGSGSTDPDGDSLTFAWTWLSIPSSSTLTDADLIDSATEAPQFTPDAEGTYELSLEVCDPSSECDSDNVTVTVITSTNTTPVCAAGADQAVDVGETVNLDASASTDADGDSLSFYWVIASAPSGSTAFIPSPANTTATLVPDLNGTYKINLWGNDGIDYCFDRVVIEASGLNTAPIADAGGDQESCSFETIQLDGTASFDAEGDTLSYSWSFDSLPADSGLSDSDISGSGSSEASFTPDTGGTYSLTLTVGDGTDTDSDTTTIEIGSDGTVLVMHTDEGSGTTAFDDSGNANDGELVDLAWTGGRFFGGLEFDGANSTIRIEDDDSLDLTETMTIQWWMRTDTLVSGYQAVMMKGYPYNYSIWTYDDSLMFYGYIGTTGTTVYVNGTANLGDGAWHHYAVTADGSTLTIYEDGIALASSAYSGSFQDNTSPLYIGRTSWTPSYYLFDGGFDELVFHTEALSTSEIADLAAADTQYCTDDADIDGPTLSITTPSSGSTSESTTINIEGTAYDESAILSLEVNGIETTPTDLNYATWTAETTLAPGSNVIEVVAIDIAGNQSSTSITVDYEAEACGADDVLLLTMDEDTPGLAVDESPNGLDGTGQSTIRVTGVHGNAVQFDGTNSYMTIPHDDALSMGDEFAIELWYRRDGSTTAYEVLAMKGGYNYGLIAYGGFIIFAYTDSLGDSYNANAFGFNDGDWHHVVGVYDGSDVHLYVDGELEASESAGLAPASNSDDLYMGGFEVGSYNFEGEIDQVRLHDAALNTDEVFEHYVAPPACMPSDNLAPLGTATASDEYGSSYDASRIIDENTDESSSSAYTYWLLPEGETGWVEVDLGVDVAVYNILWANTHVSTFYNGATADYTIELSTSGAFSGEEIVVESGTGTMETDLVFHEVELTTPITARYVRFYVDSIYDQFGGLNELQVFGVEAP